jgi:DNA-binding LacI/PurR family transcriptional regulator
MNISQIALLAGVSKATVSRVINKLPGVRPETIEKINAVIKDTGWAPSNGARNLTKKIQGHIAVIAEDVTNPFYHDIIKGVHEICLERNFQFIMSNSYSSVGRREKMTDYFMSGGADGLILIESDLLDGDIIDYARKKDARPLVLIENNTEGLPSVEIDNFALGSAAAQYLLSLGHTRIAHITGNYNFRVARDRHAGFAKTLSENNIEQPSRFLMYGDFNWKSGYDTMGRLMGSNPRPTAVYAANDEMAYAAWKAVLDMGMRVPEDVSILGTDGLKLFRDNPPRLSTIRQPCREMGREAARMLFSRLDGKKSEDTMRLILPFKLNEGDTCTPFLQE